MIARLVAVAAMAAFVYRPRRRPSWQSLGIPAVMASRWRWN